jgi:hypothetical protein
MAKWTKIGAVIAKKPNEDGSSNGVYIKLSEGVEKVRLKNGMSLSVTDPRKSLDEAVAKGRMDQEKAEYLRSKIKDFIKFEIFAIEE